MKPSKAKKTNLTLRGILICMILLVMVIAGSIASIHAYFTDTDSVTNNLTVGNNTIKIVEFEDGWAVQNTGTVDCYVRVFAEVERPEQGTVVVSGADWTSKQSDGYYYYEKVVTPFGTAEDTTTKLMADATGLIIYAESIQAEVIADNAIEAFSEEKKL